MFQKFRQQQNSVFYENKNQGFFDYINSKIDINSISIIERNESLQLQANQTHEVCDDDRFILRPLNSIENNFNSKKKSVIIQIIQAKAFTSYFKILKMMFVWIQME